jgi:hypothetical protein
MFGFWLSGEVLLQEEEEKDIYWSYDGDRMTSTIHSHQEKYFAHSQKQAERYKELKSERRDE